MAFSKGSDAGACHHRRWATKPLHLCCSHCWARTSHPCLRAELSSRTMGFKHTWASHKVYPSSKYTRSGPSLLLEWEMIAKGLRRAFLKALVDLSAINWNHTGSQTDFEALVALRILNQVFLQPQSSICQSLKLKKQLDMHAGLDKLPSHTSFPGCELPSR